ncbi:MAG: hypothetical protein IJM18_08345 [Clostridia bacterium]|nr:hypothetical protein [Clostridia bacterium]
MKARKTIAIILAVFPLFLLAAGIILDITFKMGVKIDPYYWREHIISLISELLFISCLICTVPCIIAARVLNNPLSSNFIDIITWIDILAIVIPLIRIFASLVLRK